MLITVHRYPFPAKVRFMHLLENFADDLGTGCGDVVTKPKLVKHKNKCHADVTCLDCNTT